MAKVYSLSADRIVVGRCRNCNWWQAMSERIGFCKLVSATNEFPPSSRMRVEAHDDLCKADLFTAPDFGCVEFSPRKDRAP
jgi:hypothetical protein